MDQTVSPAQATKHGNVSKSISNLIGFDEEAVRDIKSSPGLIVKPKENYDLVQKHHWNTKMDQISLVNWYIRPKNQPPPVGTELMDQIMQIDWSNTLIQNRNIKYHNLLFDGSNLDV